jgi:uncharacterized protein involved in exopolysaccharide biosynthesis/Mrp family chromosome partitioning ATPase
MEEPRPKGCLVSLPVYRPLTPHAPRSAAQGFDLADFFGLIDKRKKLILQVTAATVIAAVLFAFSLPTVWSSAAVVMLEPRPHVLADGTAAPPAQIDPATMQNQIQILESRELAEHVVDRLELQNDPEFNGTLSAPGLGALVDPRNWGGNVPSGGSRQREQIIEAFQRSIWAEQNGLSTSITVGARARDPEKAARLANALAAAYVEGQLNRKQNSSSQTTEWLDARAANLAREVQLQNEAIQRFKASRGITDTAPGSSLNDQQMAAVNAQIAQARSDLEQKLAIQRSLQSHDPANTSQALASLTIQNLRSQLAEVTRREADINLRYGPLHPSVQQIQVQRRDLESRIGQESARLTAAANADVEAARNLLASLQGNLARAQSVAVGQNMARGELASMEANAASTRTAYEAFIARLRNAQDQDASLASESRLLSAAAVPQSPASPKRKLIVGASLPLGMMLGILMALIMEKFGYLLRPRSHRRNGASNGRAARRVGGIDMEQWDGPPILGEINNAGSIAAADYVLDWPKSRFTHASVNLVRQLESRGGEGSVVALTAPEPCAQKSVVAVAMARAAARMGKKTIIIDCDPSHRAGAALQAQPQAGLYEVLTGAVPLHDALVKDPRSQAFVLSLRERPAHAAAMYNSPQMARLLDILRDACDFVILDCSPALAAPDAALIARHADATILVSKREKLRTRSLSHATQLLQDAKAAPVGLVLAS